MFLQFFRITRPAALLVSLVFTASVAGQNEFFEKGFSHDRSSQNFPVSLLSTELDFVETASSDDSAVHSQSPAAQETPGSSAPISNSILNQPNVIPSTAGILPQAEMGVLSQTASNTRLFNGEVYASFDFMFLERSGPSPQAFVFTDGAPSLNTTSFTYDAEFTPAATIAIGDPFGYALEFNFLSSANHRFNSVQAGTNVVPVFFGGIPATPVNSYTVEAQSQMDNYELNQWASFSPRLRLGLGLRIIDMREVFDITETGTSSGFFSITDNELFGGQFAAQYVFFSNNLATVYFQGKSGLYYNRVKVAATSQNLVMNPDSDEMSFVGDLRLVADFPLTDLISLRAGYQATFFNRIAQGMDQNDDLFIGNPTNPGLFDFSSPTYRGGFFGLVIAY